MLLVNIMLALIWTAITGRFTVPNLLAGFVLGYLVLYLTRNALGAQLYSRRVRRAIAFAVFFAWELLMANLRVARDAITPRHYMDPALLAVPLDATSDAEITFLANLITLTPGTMTLDVSTDRKFLYIHEMYAHDVQASKARIKRLERKLLGALR